MLVAFGTLFGSVSNRDEGFMTIPNSHWNYRKPTRDKKTPWPAANKYVNIYIYIYIYYIYEERERETEKNNIKEYEQICSRYHTIATRIWKTYQISAKTIIYIYMYTYIYIYGYKNKDILMQDKMYIITLSWYKNITIMVYWCTYWCISKHI